MVSAWKRWVRRLSENIVAKVGRVLPLFSSGKKIKVNQTYPAFFLLFPERTQEDKRR